MTRDELALVDSACYELAAKIIETQKTHVPMLMCLPGGPVSDVSGYMENERGKNILGAIMHKLAERFECICLISEAWIVELQNGDKSAKADLVAAGVSPASHPDRVEVLSFLYRAKGLGAVAAHHRIITEDGRRRLERGALTYPDHAEGRFVS